jgi:transcriptional regulator with XRE-family HTH domain
MRLYDYIKKQKITVESFANDIGVSQPTIRRYIKRLRIPSPNIMVKIFIVTNGLVQPNDFFDLPDNSTVI